MLKPKIPPLQKCKFQRATVLAMGAGIGAACGYGLLSWWYAAALLPFLFLLNFRQLIYAASGFLLCAASGIIQKNLISSENIPFQPERISGVIICTDRRTSGMFPEQKRSPVKCEIESGGKKFTAKAEAKPEKKKKSVSALRSWVNDFADEVESGGKRPGKNKKRKY